MIVAAQAGPLLAGALVGVEGIFALTVPLVVAPMSDGSGQRLPYIALAVALMPVPLVLIGVSGSLLLIGLALLVFYVGYFASNSTQTDRQSPRPGRGSVWDRRIGRHQVDESCRPRESLAGQRCRRPALGCLDFES
ncbi:MAG TPA: hypothetical protein VGR11_07820 [Solirubrobacteraceae bacterium]|nr:hypothetical protein [Solirubrobacteraceae bacterium]